MHREFHIQKITEGFSFLSFSLTVKLSDKNENHIIKIDSDYLKVHWGPSILDSTGTKENVVQLGFQLVRFFYKRNVL